MRSGTVSEPVRRPRLNGTELLSAATCLAESPSRNQGESGTRAISRNHSKIEQHVPSTENSHTSNHETNNHEP